jgi:hypothetical protein
MKSDKLVKLPEGMLIGVERFDHHKINFIVFSFFSLWFFFQLRGCVFFFNASASS